MTLDFRGLDTLTLTQCCLTSPWGSLKTPPCYQNTVRPLKSSRVEGMQDPHSPPEQAEEQFIGLLNEGHVQELSAFCTLHSGFHSLKEATDLKKRPNITF